MWVQIETTNLIESHGNPGYPFRESLEYYRGKPGGLGAKYDVVLRFVVHFVDGSPSLLLVSTILSEFTEARNCSSSSQITTSTLSQ